MIIPGVTKGKGIFIPQDPMKIKRDIKSSGDLVIPDICLENVPKVKDIVVPDAPKKVVPKVVPNKGKGMYYNPPQKQQRGYAPQPAYNKGNYQTRAKVCTITHHKNNKEDTLHNQSTTREITKEDTLHNHLTTREVTKKDTLHNQPITREVTIKNNTLHNQPTTREVTKDNNTLHNQPTTRE